MKTGTSADTEQSRMLELERKRRELLQKKRQKILELKDLLDKKENGDDAGNEGINS